MYPCQNTSLASLHDISLPFSADLSSAWIRATTDHRHFCYNKPAARVINPSVEWGVECDGGPPTRPGGVVTDVVLVETAGSIAESDQLIVERRSVSTAQSSIAGRAEIVHQAATPRSLVDFDEIRRIYLSNKLPRFQRKSTS